MNFHIKKTVWGVVLMSSPGSSRIIMGLSVAAIAIALAAIFVATASIQEETDEEESEYAP